MAKGKSSGDWDSEENEVASNWMSWGVPVEDKIFGTLIAKRTMKSQLPGKEGELVNVYELKADKGFMHKLDAKKNPIEPGIEIAEGDIYNIGGKAGIDTQMRNIKVGQKVGFKFIDETESKTRGFAPSKNIKVFAPKNADGTPQMDEEWLAANPPVDPLQAEFDKE